MRYNLTKIYSFFKTGKGILSLAVVAAALILNYLWRYKYGFDHAPVNAINYIVGANFFILYLVGNRVKLASFFLLAMSATLCFLGFILMRGLLSIQF